MLDMQITYCNDHYGKAKWGSSSLYKRMGVTLHLEEFRGNVFSKGGLTDDRRIEFEFDNDIIGDEFEKLNYSKIIPVASDAKVWEYCQLEEIVYQIRLLSGTVGFFVKAENPRYVYIAAVSDRFEAEGISKGETFSRSEAANKSYEQILTKLTQDGWEVFDSEPQKEWWRVNLRRKYSGQMDQADNRVVTPVTHLDKPEQSATVPDSISSYIEKDRSAQIQQTTQSPSSKDNQKNYKHSTNCFRWHDRHNWLLITFGSSHLRLYP